MLIPNDLNIMLNKIIHLPFRSSRLLAAFICHELIVIAMYFQFVDHLEPCPLCIFQRLVFMALAVLFFIAAIHNPKPATRTIYNSLTLLATLIGVFISSRHVWLQHLPADQVPTCGPGLNYLLDTLPLGDALHQILSGSGECAKVSWTLMGLSMPEWTLLIFLGIALWLSAMIWSAYRHRN